MPGSHSPMIKIRPNNSRRLNRHLVRVVVVAAGSLAAVALHFCLPLSHCPTQSPQTISGEDVPNSHTSSHARIGTISMIAAHTANVRQNQCRRLVAAQMA